MEILVSFCNVWTPGLPALGLLDPTSFSFRLLRIPSGLPPNSGVRGLAMAGRYLFMVLQETPVRAPGLVVLDSDRLEIVNQYQFQSTGDVHSIVATDDALYAVSTGTDEVLKLERRDAAIVSETVFWRPEPEAPRADIHHLNAILGWRGDLLVSGFGKKNGPLWSSARDGFIANISRNEPVASSIRHPHSIAAVGDTIAYCESAEKSVRILADGRAGSVPGYARGLCLIPPHLFVGTSNRRRVSKSTGIVMDVTDADGPAALCAISRLSLATLATEQTIDLSDYAKEVYDLLPVDGTAAWPVESEDWLRRSATTWWRQVQVATEEIAERVPAGERCILADAGQWGADEAIAGRRCVPFIERQGQYWGPPPDDGTAVAEVERLRRAGAGFMVFGWPAFWWLSHYSGLHQYLRARFPCVMENERVVVFDLRDRREVGVGARIGKEGM